MSDQHFPIKGLAAVLGLAIWYACNLHSWYWDDGAQIENGCVDYGFAAKCWWQNDIVSSTLLRPIYTDLIDSWNNLISIDGSKTAFGLIAVIIYAVFAGLVMKHLADWWLES